MPADRMKMAVARWRTAQGLRALGARTGVMDAHRRYGSMRRVDLLARVRRSLSSTPGSPAADPRAPLQNSLPGLNRYLDSLPRVSLPANPGGGINKSLVPFQHKQLPFLYRGGSGLDPHRGGSYKGVAHATPHPDVASYYAEGAFPAISVFRTHPKQRFTHALGMERARTGRRLGEELRGSRLQKFLRRGLVQGQINPMEMYETMVSPRRNPLVGTYISRGSGQFVEPSRSVLRQLTERVYPDEMAARLANTDRSIREIISRRLPIRWRT